MSKLKEQFIQQMVLKNYSKRTIENYIRQIQGLSVYYNLSPDLITQQQIRDYLQHRISIEKVSKSWVNIFISALKILLCEVLKRQWDVVDIPRPRREKKLPLILSRDEVSRLIQCTRNQKHRSIFMVAYGGGLRIGEVINLKIGDIDSKRMMMRIVLAKGFKDRYCQLSPILLNQLRNYWKLFTPKTYLFETKPNHPITDRTVQTVFKQALKRAGIDKKATMHTLRHSYATHLMEQGVNLPLIQQLLGHKSLKTTSVYLHVQQYSIDAVQSPLDNIKL
jgi:integrase/recombinase XerD